MQELTRPSTAPECHSHPNSNGKPGICQDTSPLQTISFLQVCTFTPVFPASLIWTGQTWSLNPWRLGAYWVSDRENLSPAKPLVHWFWEVSEFSKAEGFPPNTILFLSLSQSLLYPAADRLPFSVTLNSTQPSSYTRCKQSLNKPKYPNYFLGVTL